MSFIPYWEKTKEQKHKYYLDHKATYLEKVECKDCKKMISRIHFNKHLLTKSHLNIVNKIKIEKVDKKAMFSCPCGGKFDGGHRTSHYKTKIHKLYEQMYDKQVKREQKELLEYKSYRSFADRFYNTSQFQKEEKERNEYNSDDEYDLFRHFKL
jgi:hypothetical protein